jgi:CHAT domain-containing protein
MPPPTQQDQLITPEEAARQLFDLVNSASVAQLLQHQPPAAVSERQQYLLQRCSYALSVVITLVNSATLTAEQVRCREQLVW